MLDRSILLRCRHDPDSSARRETERGDYNGMTYVQIEAQCLRCDATQLESEPLPNMQPKYGREIVADD